jgi:hypothetical protein
VRFSPPAQPATPANSVPASDRCTLARAYVQRGTAPLCLRAFFSVAIFSIPYRLLVLVFFHKHRACVASPTPPAKPLQKRFGTHPAEPLKNVFHARYLAAIIRSQAATGSEPPSHKNTVGRDHSNTTGLCELDPLNPATIAIVRSPWSGDHARSCANFFTEIGPPQAALQADSRRPLPTRARGQAIVHDRMPIFGRNHSMTSSHGEQDSHSPATTSIVRSLWSGDRARSPCQLLTEITLSPAAMASGTRTVPLPLRSRDHRDRAIPYASPSLPLPFCYS